MPNLLPTLRRFKFLEFLYLSTTTSLLWVAFRSWTYDDPYITYRYALNLAGGTGLVYNPGQPVLSTTSPLFSVVLAGLSQLGFDIPMAANLLGALSLAAGGLFLSKTLKRMGSPFAGWFVLFLYPTSILIVKTLGSETPLSLALCLAAILTYMKKDYSWAGLFTGLAGLARGDALVVAGLLVLDWLFRRRNLEISAQPLLFRRIPWRGLLLFSAILLAWILPASIYYGSPLPATLAAKQAQAHLPASDSFLVGLWQLGAELGKQPGYWLAGLLAVAGIALSARRRPETRILVIWPFLFTLGYAALKVTRYYWYYAQLAPGLMAAVGLALGEIAGFDPLLQGSPSNPPTGRSRSRGVSVGLAVLLGGSLFVAQLRDLSAYYDSIDLRYSAYRSAGEWLRDNAAEDALAATLEVGIIGYYAWPVRLVDFAGLIYPPTTAQFTSFATFDDAALWLARELDPDYLIIPTEGYDQLQHGFIRRRCVPVKYIQAQDFSLGVDLIIFQCEPPAQPG